MSAFDPKRTWNFFYGGACCYITSCHSKGPPTEPRETKRDQERPRETKRDQERPREIRVALPSTKFENAKSNGLATVAAGANCFARVSGKLADARHRCRRSTGYNVGTRWYRVRRRIGRTRYLWSLRDHRPATGLCIVRA